MTHAMQCSAIAERTPVGDERAPRRRGVAAVEFAIVAPIFFMLVIGIIEVGRAMMVQQVLINASRVGARRAVMLSSSTTGGDRRRDRVRQRRGRGGRRRRAYRRIRRRPRPVTAITVERRINFANVSWMPAPWFMGGKTLTSSSVMRKEGF